MKDLTFKRHRRLRQSATMRSMVKETYLHKEDFIYPIFVMDGENIKMKYLRCQAFSNFQLIG